MCACRESSAERCGRKSADSPVRLAQLFDDAGQQQMRSSTLRLFPLCRLDALSPPALPLLSSPFLSSSDLFSTHALSRLDLAHTHVRALLFIAAASLQLIAPLSTQWHRLPSSPSSAALSYCPASAPFVSRAAHAMNHSRLGVCFRH